MADDNIVMALDLNQEPFIDPSPPSSPPTPDEPETSRFGIVDRIRHLQAVTARANQRQWWRRFMNKNQGDNGIRVVNKERVRVNCKRDISHLAKALEMDLEGKEKENGNFYDCNICLGVAKVPILTSCGHLFCRSCFDLVPYVDSVSKECPTCQGEVTDANITPIHGNAKNSWWF